MRCQESPGASWINARKEYDNFFKNNFRIVDVCSGATRYVNKSKRKPLRSIERYKVCRIDDIDYDQQRWKIEYDDTTDKK